MNDQTTSQWPDVFGVPLLWGPWWYVHKNLRNTRDTIRYEILLCLIKLMMGFRTSSHHRVFPLTCRQQRCMEGFREACTQAAVIISNWSSVALPLIERCYKESNFANKEFLHRKINNKDVVWIMVLQKVSQIKCM